jgi:hypothetical protein
MNAKLDARLRAVLGVTGVLIAMLVVPAEAQGPELAMLDGLRDGAWDIKIRGEDSKSRICVHAGRELIQIRHKQQACQRLVVEDGPMQVTVHYSCPKSGFGQTTIRKEGPTLVQISTQGVEGKLPFNFDAEGRYAGTC